MVITPWGILSAPVFLMGHWIKAVMDLLYRTPSMLTYRAFPSSTLIRARELQLLKTSFPMNVTLLLMVIEGKDMQSLNAALPIYVTLAGIVTDLREEQPWNVPFPMVRTV